MLTLETMHQSEIHIANLFSLNGSRNYAETFRRDMHILFHSYEITLSYIVLRMKMRILLKL